MELLQNKRIQYLIGLSNIAFLILYAVLAYYNRFSHDDFYFMHLYESAGVFGGVDYLYQHYTTRFAAMYTNLCLISQADFQFLLFFYSLGLLILFVISIFTLIISFSLAKSFDFWSKLNFSLFIVSAIFYSTFRIGETWFWLASSSAYALSVGYTILGVAIVFKYNYSWQQFIVIVLLFFLVGGSNATLSILLLVMALVLFLLKNKIHLSIPISKKLIVAVVACGLGFVILYFGPGNDVRSQSFNQISVFKSIALNFKTSAMILLLRIPSVLPILLMFGIVPSLLLKDKMKVRSDSDFLRKSILIVLSFVGVVFFFQWPITFKTQDIGAYRTLFPISIISLIFLIVWFYQLWQKLNFSDVFRLKVVPFILLSILLVQIGVIVNQFPTVQGYAHACDERIDYLKANANKSDTLWLEPLPDSGLLHSSEITNLTNHFTNQHLKKGMGLKAEVALKTNGFLYIVDQEKRVK